MAHPIILASALFGAAQALIKPAPLCREVSFAKVVAFASSCQDATWGFPKLEVPFWGVP